MPTTFSLVSTNAKAHSVIGSIIFISSHAHDIRTLTVSLILHSSVKHFAHLEVNYVQITHFVYEKKGFTIMFLFYPMGMGKMCTLHVFRTLSITYKWQYNEYNALYFNNCIIKNLIIMRIKRLFRVTLVVVVREYF